MLDEGRAVLVALFPLLLPLLCSSHPRPFIASSLPRRCVRRLTQLGLGVFLLLLLRTLLYLLG